MSIPLSSYGEVINVKALWWPLPVIKPLNIITHLHTTALMQDTTFLALIFPQRYQCFY